VKVTTVPEMMAVVRKQEFLVESRAAPYSTTGV
jgi:hypothetical protein